MPRSSRDTYFTAVSIGQLSWISRRAKTSGQCRAPKHNKKKYLAERRRQARNQSLSYYNIKHAATGYLKSEAAGAMSGRSPRGAYQACRTPVHDGGDQKVKIVRRAVKQQLQFLFCDPRSQPDCVHVLAHQMQRGDDRVPMRRNQQIREVGIIVTKLFGVAKKIEVQCKNDRVVCGSSQRK